MKIFRSFQQAETKIYREYKDDLMTEISKLMSMVIRGGKDSNSIPNIIQMITTMGKQYPQLCEKMTIVT